MKFLVYFVRLFMLEKLGEVLAPELMNTWFVKIVQFCSILALNTQVFLLIVSGECCMEVSHIATNVCVWSPFT